MLLGQHRNCVRALEFGGRLAHCREQTISALEIEVDQMRNDFRVGVGDEFVADRTEPLADLFVVLDDAVVHHRQSVLADVRMRIAFGRGAMGRPASVRDAQAAMHLCLFHHFGERRHAADAAQPVHAAVDDRKPCRIVTAVLELAQAFEQDWNNVAPRYGSYDSAHVSWVRREA